MLKLSVILLVGSALASAALAQDVTEETERSAAEKKAEAALKVIQLLDVRPALKDEKVARIERPLLTFGDPARKNDSGTLWAWGQKGRPLAFVELYRGEDARWVHALTLTSTERIIMTTAGDS